MVHFQDVDRAEARQSLGARVETGAEQDELVAPARDCLGNCGVDGRHAQGHQPACGDDAVSCSR